ncbi:MAG: hypothetical protein RRC07_03065 [Anaerolineae bacterium]|nr:hypothetical protein [Anaerolineae bacterium]
MASITAHRIPGRSGWSILLLAAAALMLHGLVLLNDGLYVDGWLYYVYLSEPRWNLLAELLAQQGIPQVIILFRFLSLFPDFLLAYKVVAFLSILASGLSIYAIARELHYLSRFESLFLAVFAMAFPAYQYAVEISHLWNVVPYALFYAGWYLAFRAARAAHERTALRHLTLRLGALLLLIASFMNGALLVYTFGLLILYLHHVARMRRLPLRAIASHAVTRHADFLLLPFAFWLVASVSLSREGVFASYNQLSAGSLFSVGAWWQFARDGIFAQVGRSIRLLPVWPALLVLAGVLLLNARCRLEARPLLGARVPLKMMAAFGLALLLLAALPFVAVGKLPEPYGFNTRVTLLTGLPVAILSLAFFRATFSLGDRTVHRSGFLALTLLFTAFWLAQLDSYLVWQARWVKEQSILAQLPSLDSLDDFDILYIDDRYLLRWPSGAAHPANQYVNLRYFQEWTAATRHLFGPDQSQAGIDIVYLEPAYAYYEWVMDLRAQTSPPAADLFFLAAVAPGGCTATLVVEETETAANISIVGLSRRYWQYRLLQPARLQPFLRSLTTLELEPLAAGHAVDCEAMVP